jgi:alpha-L-arabinofuranosidase
MKTLFIFINAIFFLAMICCSQEKIHITVNEPSNEINIAPNMFGIFFEDINFAADGGLYAELIKNRSFDFPHSPFMGWLTYGKVEVHDKNGPFPRNPNYLRLINDGLLTGTGIINEGFRGIGVVGKKEYLLRFYARNLDQSEQKLKIELISEQNFKINSNEILINQTDWKEYRLMLKPEQSCAHAKLRIDLISNGSIEIEHVSLFPVDTWKKRENGMRKDLVQALADLNPGILRFPGGCVIEGNTLETRYNWKNSIGPVENRPINENRWNYEFQHRFTPDYFQSYGLGFFEYFLLCKDLGADPVPVVNAGMACQYVTDECVPLEELHIYIQDALDLIEFANGPINSRWGKIRAEMGHPEPFNMKKIGIGNEQWGKIFPVHLKAFQKAIKEKYPEINIIGSSGPLAEGKRFDYLWNEMKLLDVELVDEHYYKDTEWFLQNADRYDKYSRRGPKVFAGEYACHHQPHRRNTFFSALCEAAFLTGIERNSDVVRLATYAPLFAHYNAWQWKPNMIWFDNVNVIKSANYYVQQLYRQYQGTHVMEVKWNNQNVIGQKGIYASVVTDKITNKLIVKLVNINKRATEIEINLNLNGLPNHLEGKRV